VVKTLTAGRTVNDCLELLALLDLREETGAGLGPFARAELLRLQGRRAEAAAGFAAVAATGGTLGGEAALRRAAVQREDGQAELALAGLDSLVSGEQDPVIHARALERMGDIAWRDLRDGARARGAWERMLVEHPDSYLADAVRRQLRKLPAAVP
jgi:predicted negative regulator of RcsB-dependent stress response